MSLLNGNRLFLPSKYGSARLPIKEIDSVRFLSIVIFSSIIICALPSESATAGILAQYKVIGKSVSTEMGKKTTKDIDKIILLILVDDKVYLLSDDSPIGIDNKSMRIWREKWVEISAPSSSVIDIKAQDQRIKKMRQIMEQKQAMGDYSPVSLEDIGEAAPRSKVKRKMKQFQLDSFEQFRAHNDLTTMELFNDTFYEKFFGVKDAEINLAIQNKSKDINGFRCVLWHYEFGHKLGLMSVTGLGSNGKAWVTLDGRLRPVAEAIGKIPADIFNFIKMATTIDNLLSVMRQTNGVPIRIDETLKIVYGNGSDSHSISIELADFEIDKSALDLSLSLPGRERDGFLKMMTES